MMFVGWRDAATFAICLVLLAVAVWVRPIVAAVLSVFRRDDRRTIREHRERMEALR